MQLRPEVVVPPLTLVLPHSAPHPPGTSLRSSLSSPHTPTSSHSVLPLFSPNANRKSTSSWNSSNCEGIEEEFEWKPEQLRLLSRTLDALPSHLLTPFNGPVPPSNLLDKIARGVSKAKGPLDWPHSLRATRAKIVELARICTKDTLNEGASDTIAEEDGSDCDVLQQTTNTSHGRPLYRQSSMDFMQNTKPDIKNNVNINRLSYRLQMTDRMISNPTYHPYTHHSARSSSPYGPANRESFPPTLNLSTPSSTTLNSGVSGSHAPRLRRSLSSISNSSDLNISSAIDPRVRRVKHSDSYASPASYTPTRGFKRAPSFGASSRLNLDAGAMNVDRNSREADVSSDEEEKLRSMCSKKARMKATSPILPEPSQSLSPGKTRSRAKPACKPSPAIPKGGVPKSDSTEAPARGKRPTKPKANKQRNPSMFGGELPNPQQYMEPHIRSSPRLHKSPQLAADIIGKPGYSSPLNLTHIPPMTPATPVTPRHPKTLRRTKATVNRGVPIKKISFGSLIDPSEDTAGSGTGSGLGSAFQLH